MMNIAPGIFIIIVGVVFTGLVLLSALIASRRQRRFSSEEIIAPLNLVSVTDAVVVARVGGQVNFANEIAEQWFGLGGVDPDLWTLAQRANPSEALLELFAAEGQAKFTIDGRSVEATSHQIAVGDSIQFIVVMREETPLPTLDKEERGSTRALQVLSEIGQAINASLDLPTTMDSTLEGISRLIPYTAAQICLWEQEFELLRPVARRGPDLFIAGVNDEGQAYRTNEGYSGWVASRRSALLVDNVSTFDVVRPLIRPTDPLYGSYLGVPMSVRNRFIGTLELFGETTDSFSREDQALLALIAEQSGIAIENAREYSQQAERVMELSGLQKIAGAISSLQDPYQLFKQLGQRVSELMGTDMAGVLLFDRDQERLIAQKPLHNVDDVLAARYELVLAKGSPARSLWEDVSFWFCNDVPNDHLVQEMGMGMLAELTGVKTTAMAAMTVGEERIGVLQASNKVDGTAFNLEDIRLLQIYADQAAIVVESARLYAEEQSRVAELQGLQQIVQTMGAFSNPDELFAQLTQRIAELMRVEICGVLIYDSIRGRLTARTPFFGISDEIAHDYSFAVDEGGLAREVWREHELFESSLVTMDDNIDELGLRDIARSAGLRTLLMAPLSTGGRRFGMLQISNKLSGHEFDEGDRRLLTIFAGQAAALIDNVRLYQDTGDTLRKRSAELASVSRISHELNATLELERILEVIAREALRAEGADHGNLTMFEWVEDQPEFIPIMRFGDEIGQEARILERAAARSGETLVIDDFDKVEHYPSPIPEARSALIVPIMSEDQPVGVICLYSNRPSGLGPSAAEYVQALSSQATSAVTNARRHAEQVERSDLLRRRAEQLTQIFELGRMFRSDQSVDDNLTSVCRAIRDTVGFDQVLVSVLNEDQETLSYIAQSGVHENLFEKLQYKHPRWDVARKFMQSQYQLSGSYLIRYTDSPDLIKELGLPKEGQPEDESFLNQWWPGDILMVPLHSSSGDVLGMLTVDEPRSKLVPTRNVVELLEIFGNQAAVVIENSRLYRSVEERAEELRIKVSDLEKSYEKLNNLSQEMIRKDMELEQANELLNIRAQRLLAMHRVMESVDTSLSPREVLQNIAASVVEEMDVDLCLVALSNGTENSFDVVATEGRFPKKFNLGNHLTGKDPLSVARRTQKAVLYTVKPTDRIPISQLASDIGANTLAVLPMQLDSSRTGILLLGSIRPGISFGEDDRDLFNLLASQIAVEYENARLYQAVQNEAATTASERDRLQQLHLITTALQQTQQFNDRLHVIARGIHSVGWNRVALTLMDKDMNPGQLVTAGYSDEEKEALQENQIPSGTWQQWLADQGFGNLRVGSSYLLACEHPWVQEHAKDYLDGKPDPDADPKAWQPPDQLLLPMYAGSEIIGVINLRDPVDGQRPDETALRPLELFVQQASSALENMRLYQETLELQSYNEAVVQSIQQGIVVTDAEGTVESLNDFVREKFGWSADLVGQNLFTAMPALRELGLAGNLAAVVRYAEQIERGNLSYTVGDTAHTLNVAMYPRYEDGQTVTGVVVLLEDTTQRARLEADIALRGQQLAALSDVSRRITASLNVGDVVTNALDMAEEVLHYDTADLWLYGIEEGDLGVAGSMGRTEPLTRRVDIETEQPYKEIMRNRMPVSIGDVREDDRISNTEALSWLGLPMFSGGIFVGILEFSKDEAHAFPPADVQVAEAFANQVAVAIENARLFEEVSENALELSNRARRLAMLNEISATLSRSLDQSSIFQSTVDQLVQALDAPQGSVILFDNEAAIGTLTIQYPSNPDGSVEEMVIPLNGNPAVKQLQETRTPLAITDVSKDPLADAMRKQLTSRGVKSTLLIPLSVGLRVIGLITIDSTTETREFAPAQIELAQTITNQAAVAVQNASLYQETVMRRGELAILSEAAQIASASLDLDTVVKDASEYYTRSMQVDGCTISLWDVKQDTLFTLADYDREEGLQELTEDSHRYTVRDYKATASVVRDKGVVVIKADNPGLSTLEKAWLQAKNVQTVLMVPLVARDETIGLVELWDQSGDRTFRQRDIRLATSLGAAISTAMENARLHDETQKRVGELSTINAITRSLAQTVTTEDLLQTLQSQMGKVLNTRSLTIARRDPFTGQLTFPLAIRDNKRISIDPIGYGADLYSYLIGAREPILINRDIKARLKELGVDHIEPGLKSFAGVPLVSGEQVTGVLAIEDYENENAFDDADLRVLGPLAAQAAVSIENTRLYSELEQRLSELTTLQEVSRVVNSALNLQEIFDRVVHELSSAFRFPWVGLFTVEGENLIRLQAYHGHGDEDPKELQSLTFQDGIIGRTVRTKQAQFVPDASRDADYRLVYSMEWVRSLIAVPIVSEEEVLGVLNVRSSEDRPLTENDLKLLLIFAMQVATAMTNASLYAQMVELSTELEARVEERTRELREERDRIDTLYRIAVELAASLDLDRVLNRALELVGEAVGAERGQLFLADPHSDQLIYRALLADGETLPPGGRQIPISRHEGMAGWVMDNRQSLKVDNVQVDPRWANIPGTETRRSLLGAPLEANEEVLGCIFFISDTEAAFNDGHLQLVEAAATQVAVSINNAELYRMIADQAERLGAMLRSQQTEAAKSQAILESVADGVMVSDQSGSIILFNAAAERILELRRDEVLGRSSADLAGLYGAGAERWSEILREWSKNPMGYQEDFVADQLELGNKVVSVHVSPVMHGDEYLGLVSVFRNITREVIADRVKSEFVATVSHELRTPMTSIKGYADLLLLGAAGDITEEQRRFLEVVKANADRLSALVNDLLDISRIEQGGVDLELRPVNLGEVISDVMISMEGRRENDGRNLEMQTVIPDDLPAIEADYDRVTQILINLVSNGYQYTPDGGSIRVEVTPEDSGIQINVSDTGIGIPEDAQQRIFERFFRGEDPLVMKTAGTGLGLSIVQHLVKMHNGRVWFESKEGEGTTFSVWLPYQVTDDQKDAEQQNSAA